MKKKSKATSRKAPKIKKLTARYLEEVTGGGLVPRIIDPPPPPPPPSCSQCTVFPK